MSPSSPTDDAPRRVKNIADRPADEGEQPASHVSVSEMSIAQMQKELRDRNINARGLLERRELEDALHLARAADLHDTRVRAPEPRSAARGRPSAASGRAGDGVVRGSASSGDADEACMRADADESEGAEYGVGKGGGERKGEGGRRASVGDDRPVSNTQKETQRIWQQEGLTEEEAAQLQSVLELSLNDPGGQPTEAEIAAMEEEQLQVSCLWAGCWCLGAPC